jgi:hypothetical protein
MADDPIDRTRLPIADPKSHAVVVPTKPGPRPRSRADRGARPGDPAWRHSRLLRLRPPRRRSLGHPAQSRRPPPRVGPAAMGKIRCPLRPASMTLDRDRRRSCSAPAPSAASPQPRPRHQRHQPWLVPPHGPGTPDAVRHDAAHRPQPARPVRLEHPTGTNPASGSRRQMVRQISMIFSARPTGLSKGMPWKPSIT